MTFEDDDLMRVWQEASREGDRAGCLSAGALARAASSEASVAERASIADHLVRCARCSEEYRVITALKPWAHDAAARTAPGGQSHPRRETGTLLYAAAAALVALVIGLGGWVAALRTENSRLATMIAEQGTGGSAVRQAAPDHDGADERKPADDKRPLERPSAETARTEQRIEPTIQPELNVPIVDLEPDQTTRGVERSRVVTVRSRSAWVTLVITARDHSPASQYDIEITGDEGRIVWNGSGLARSAEGTFTMLVPKDLLGNRVTHVRLFARRADGRELLGDYAIRVDAR